jgi:hypothetical protein
LSVPPLVAAAIALKTLMATLATGAGDSTQPQDKNSDYNFWES